MTDRPDMLIIMVDQMQAMLLDDDSPIPLPALRRLQSRSIRFNHAFTSAPICTPARASFQLGLPVHQHGVIGNDRSMPAGLPTLADRLNDAGYRTHYIGKWHLDACDGRGWSQFNDGRAMRPGDWGAQVMRDVNSPHEGVAPYDADQHIDGRIAALAQQQWGEHAGHSQPLAMMVSFFGPHAPYYLPAPWHDRFDLDELPLPDTFDAVFENKPEIQRLFRCRAWGVQWSADQWRRVRAAYFGYVAMLDHLIDGLLDRVDLSRTAVLFTSDHGENNGHLRMIYKGPMMYDTLVRIPLLLHAPGQTDARKDDRLLDTTDLTATLLRWAGADSAHIAGHDLLVDRWGGRPYVVSEFYEANWVNPVLEQPVAMIRDRDWKLVETRGQQAEFYDMHDHPAEVRNLIDDSKHTSRITQMRRRLSQQIAWVGQAYGASES